MNKKQNLLAIALSASFVLAGANVAEASGQVQDVGLASSEPTVDQSRPGQDNDNQEASQADNSTSESNSSAQASESDHKEDLEAASDNAEGKYQKADQAQVSNQANPVGNEVKASNAPKSTGIKEDRPAEEEKIEVSAPNNNESVGKEAPKEEKEEDKQPKAPKPLTDEEAAKLKAAAERVRPGSKVEVDKNTGWITVKTKVKEKQGDKEVEVEKTETINPYTPEGDEALIKDYDGSNRYKETDLQPGDTNQSLVNTDEKVEKDGFKFEIKNPSVTSPSKTEYGYEITIDKETGQRTYTKIYITDSGLIPAATGEKPMMNEGDKLTPESPAITYKPNENGDVTASGRQRNLGYEASEGTLKHINNVDNPSTSIGMKDNYTTNNPGTKFFGDNFYVGYKVNPWPNENDALQELKLNKNNYDPKAKFFVQGQDINTGIKVDNIDESAKERLVGQVYNPITGKIVPGASAYIGGDGNIHIKMPEGALKKDENGKTVINEDSIFNTKDYKALQHLDVKFFARPRTKVEFENIAKAPEEEYERGTYVETGAGTADINHKGKNVTIDKQGIDRYDHYNLIGDFKLNLDDTRYYDQSFLDGNNEDTSTNTSSAVKPGVPFDVNMYVPDGAGETDKSAAEMLESDRKGEASGKIIMDFIDKENKGKDEKDQWKVELKKGDITKFTITPPSSAKAGDFVAIPVEYTYTNGSKDVHWFHFVVQESDNYKPEYHAEVGYKGDTLTNNHEKLPSKDETKKNLPLSYELVMPEDGSKYKDSAGNEWTDIKVDPDTGAVTAVVPEDADIKGGENLFVEVKVNYIDEKTGEAKEEIVKAQFIARAKYKQEVTKTFNSKIPFETKVIYDDNLEIGKVVKTEGRVGETETTFKQVVINGEKGIIDENGNFVKDKEAVETRTITEKLDAEIRIGTKPAETTVTIPPDTDYETSDSLKKGDMQLKEKGEEGEVTITTKRDPETGEITTTKVTTKEAKNKKMLIGTKTENTIVHEEEIPFEYEIKFDPKLKPGDKVVDQEGKPGSKTTTYKIENSEVVGEPEVHKTDPVKAIIRVGDQKFTGETSHEVTEETKYLTIIEEDNTLPVGETKEIQPGVRGSKTTKYTQEFKDGVPGEIKEKVVSETKPQNRIIKVGTKTVTEHISKEITAEIPYGVKIEYDDTIPAGKTSVKTKGKPGSKTTEYYRNLINGKFDGDLNEREVTEKRKDPVDEVIVVGTKVAENNKDYNNDVDVEIEYVKDPSKYRGYIEKGELTKGHVETKVVNKFDPETGKIITTEEEVVTPAKQKIIVGTKDYEGTFEQEINKYIPFETEIQYDEEMEAGEYKVTQKGVTGRTKQIVTQSYKNGDLGEKQFSKEEILNEAQKQIIKVGTKPVEKIVEIPFNTEYVYDDTIDAGTVVEDKDHPGKAGSLTVKTYFDKELGKFVSVEDETKKVAPVNKIVRVGTKPNANMCPAPEIPSNPNPKPNPIPDSPDLPGEDEPELPETPGETPAKPEKPGEDKPNEPGKPGETPAKPENSDKENPNSPEGSKENPKKDGEKLEEKEANKENVSDELSRKRKDSGDVASRKSTNPKTGIGSIAPIFSSMGISIAGLLATKKKKKEDE